MMLIGNKEILGIEIGEYYEDSIQMQHVTIWVGGKNLTPDDNVVYLPAFYSSLQAEIERLGKNDFMTPNLDHLSIDEIFNQFWESEEPFHYNVLQYDLSTRPAICYFIEGMSGSSILCAYLHPIESPPVPLGKAFEVKVTKDKVIAILRETLDNLSSVWV